MNVNNDLFSKEFQAKHDVIEQIRDAAHQMHASVNQHYDKVHPYSVHLDAVAEQTRRYAPLVCDRTDDVVPVMFGAYFHDSIEDARMTYNDVLRTARRFMDEEQARLAAEIVYALTNEKGRTRAERANDRYYEGIRNTPYAPLCKCADRIANLSYSVNHKGGINSAMHNVYAAEMQHFIDTVTTSDHNDIRYHIPAEMIDHLNDLC